MEPVEGISGLITERENKTSDPAFFSAKWKAGWILTSAPLEDKGAEQDNDTHR